MSDTGGWSAPDSPHHDPAATPPSGHAHTGPHGYPGGQAGWGQAVPPSQPNWGRQPPAAKPGVIPLRPLSVTEILDGAFASMRAYPKLMFGVSAVVLAGSALVNVLVSLAVPGGRGHTVGNGATPAEILATTGTGPLISSLITLTIDVLSQAFLTGFVVVVVGRAVLGRPVSFTEAWAALRPRLLPLVGLMLLYGLIVGVASVLLIIPGVWLGIGLVLAIPALVLEPASVPRALGRSWDLVRGSWWRVFGIVLLTLLISFVIAVIVELPFDLAGGAIDFTTGAAVRTTSSLIWTAVGATIAGTVVSPFFVSAQTLLYIDQRMRREGMDIALARTAGVAAPDHPAGPAQAW